MADMDSKIQYGDWLWSLRKELGKGRPEISELSGVNTAQNIANYEHSGSWTVNKELMKLLKFYNKTVADLFIRNLKPQHFNSQDEYELFQKLLISFDIHRLGKPVEVKTVISKPIYDLENPNDNG